MQPTSLRFTQAQRLKKPAQFQAVYRSKQWGNSHLFTFNVLAQDTQQRAAVLGVTVSKKVSKRAVDRNRIKRQIKEFYRGKQAQLSDAHLVITAKPQACNASDAERWSDLEKLWAKVMAWQRWHNHQSKNPPEEA